MLIHVITAQTVSRASVLECCQSKKLILEIPPPVRVWTHHPYSVADKRVNTLDQCDRAAFHFNFKSRAPICVWNLGVAYFSAAGRLRRNYKATCVGGLTTTSLRSNDFLVISLLDCQLILISIDSILIHKPPPHLVLLGGGGGHRLYSPQSPPNKFSSCSWPFHPNQSTNQTQLCHHNWLNCSGVFRGAQGACALPEDDTNLKNKFEILFDKL